MKLITDNGKEIKINNVFVGEIKPETLMIFKGPKPLTTNDYKHIAKYLMEKFPHNYTLAVVTAWNMELKL